MTAVGTLLLWGALCAAAYQLVQLAAAQRFFRRARRQVSDRRPFAPPVTVLKPLKGAGPELERNLESFCRLRYPLYQIVCGVASPDDPAIAVVQRIQRRFPRRDIVLAVAREAGTNRKVANLVHMMRHARYDVLVLSDADVRVEPDYLHAMVAPLAEPGLGLTTALYRGIATGTLASRVESLFVNTHCLPMFVTAEWVQGLHNAYGASIAVKRQALEAIGGFASLAHHLADDYLLGERIGRAGWRLELLPHVVGTVLDATSLCEVWRHQLRWARTYRAQQPFGWFCSVITHTTLWACLTVAATRGSLLGWGTLALALACRILALGSILRLAGERETLRWLWLAPLTDLAYSLVWLASWLGRHVEWSGEVLRVEPDGRLVPLPCAERPTAPAAPAVPNPVARTAQMPR